MFIFYARLQGVKGKVANIQQSLAECQKENDEINKKIASFEKEVRYFFICINKW